MKRVCPKCKVNKSVADFAKDKSNSNGLQIYCKVCNAIKHKKHRDKYPEKYKSSIIKVRKYANAQEERRSYNLKYKYGITSIQFDDMLKEQDYKCKTCSFSFETRKQIHIDHCHSSSNVRGLLCVSCNIALGQVKDNIPTLSNMIKYLTK